MKKSIVISLLTAACIIGTALCSFASTGIVTTDTLRLRKDASTNASIIALLSMDDKVEILEEKNGWYKVIAGDKEGYVSADYIKVLEEVNAPEETEAEEETNNTEEEQNNEENIENNENVENSENVENTESEETTENQEEKVMVKTLPAETKIYITPVINSLVINTIEEESKIEVSSEVNGWSYVTAGNIKGWVRTETIVEKDEEEVEENSSQKIGYISGASVNFREEANTSSNIISKLTRNTQIRILRSEDGWSKVEYNGTKGYVSNQYISDKKVETTSRSSVNRAAKAKTTTTNTDEGTDTASQGNATGSEIVAYAKKYLGYKYVYGGATPSGFDCSGFTSYVYKHFGYSLNRTSSAQASNGKAVSKSNLQVGDIICFARSSGSKTIGHVGIYIGGGQFIHAANSRKGVIISNVDGAGFYYVCARRIV